MLIHDQECAAEKRRAAQARQAGRAGRARLRSTSASARAAATAARSRAACRVQPVETEFGRKTQIHQASCNKDYSCLEGDCPSFLTVVPRQAAPRRETAAARPSSCPSRAGSSPTDDFAVRMIGIGGTGVVTVNQVLGMAALLDGLHVVGPRPDRPRAEGRPGRLRPAHLDASRSAAPRKAPGRLASTSTSASTCSARPTPRTSSPRDPDRTVAVVSTSAVPTGRMVVDAERALPASSPARSTASTPRPAREHNLYLDAQAARRARCSATTCRPTRCALGAAYQRGMLPVSGDALEQAIRLNGAAVEKNLAAFALGPRRGRGARTPSRRATRAARAPARELSERRARAGRARRQRRRRRAAPAASRCACPSWSPTRTRPTRAATPRSCAAVHVAEQERTPGARRAGRGRRPPPVQADGLQGRVRGRAPAPRRRSSRRKLQRGVRRGRQGRASTCTRRCCARWA